MAESASPAVSQTVKVLIAERDKFLLVHERGTPRDEFDDPAFGKDGQYIKRPGWGLPGGKVEGSVPDILEAIRALARTLRMDPDSSRVRLILKRVRRLPDERAALTAVKECLEETGMLVMPFSMERWPSGPSEVLWLVRAAPVAGGTLNGGDAKILEAAWHGAGRLPNETYPRTRAMVRMATESRRKEGKR